MNAPTRKVGGWQVHPLTRGEPATMWPSALNTPHRRADRPPSPAPATVADVMRPATETVAEGDHAAAAAYLMHHASTNALVVVGYHGSQPVGVITRADIARAVADGKDVNQLRVHDLLATQKEHPRPDTPEEPSED